LLDIRMQKPIDASQLAVAASVDSPVTTTTASSGLGAIGRNAVQDSIAGLIASIVLIANIVSFGALMFPGQLNAGIPLAIWAMLIGSAVGGMWIATATSLPPLATAIDSPTGTVLILLSAMAGGRILAAGGSPQAAIQGVMLVFTAATFACGALLYGLGAFRLGSYFRFVPSSVVGGFLVATGCFLISGGIRMTAGKTFTFDALFAPWTTPEIIKLASAAGTLAVLLAVRRWLKAALAMPVTLIALWLGAGALLRLLGLSGAEHGWYFRSLGTLTWWSPFAALHTSPLTWPMLTRLIPEIFVTAIVALISLITKVSSLESARQASADLDCELRAHGIASLIAAPLGGIAGSLQVGTSRLLEHVGGKRMSGVACAVIMGIVGLANFDLPGLVPIPLVGGLVFYLGYSFIADALGRPYRNRAWLDMALAIIIAFVCLQYGYLTGVLAGLICACMLFTMSYARLGVVRRHASRALVSSHVVRSAQCSDYLRENGGTIQLYWLSGYIFFGSSEGVFEKIRADIEVSGPRCVNHVILDFELVSGSDSSALLSLTKLRSLCGRHGATLVFCSLSPASRAVLDRGGFFSGKNQARVFADLQTALAWCEEQVLLQSGIVIDSSTAGFESWLLERLGPTVSLRDLIGYLVRKDIAGPEVIYREGEQADTVDLVAAGTLNVDVVTENGGSKRVRRLATHTVVGEMGFFRRSVRSATVSSDGPVVLFTLTRQGMERMRRERPDLASAFDDFIVRTLADRLDATNRELAALE
jgi:sulfate permease, SulP family